MLGVVAIVLGIGVVLCLAGAALLLDAWGCAGFALAISASGLAAAGIASSGTPEQMAH